MSIQDVIQWFLIIAGLSGSAAAFILTKRDRDAGTYSDLTATVQGLSAEVRQLRNDLAAEKIKRRHLESGIGIVINQLRRAGIEPDWTPYID